MERLKIFEKSLLMLATFQLLPNLLKDEPDIAILFLMSDVPPSSLATLTPRYANLYNSSTSTVTDIQADFTHIVDPQYFAFLRNKLQLTDLRRVVFKLCCLVL